MTDPITIQIEQAPKIQVTMETQEVNVTMEQAPPITVVISPMGDKGLPGEKGEPGQTVYVPTDNQIPTVINGGYF